MDSSSARAGPSAAPTPRHLKRLSLSSFPAGAAALSASASSSRIASPSTVTSPNGPAGGLSSSTRPGHTPRQLRLSMSGSSSSLAYNTAPPQSALAPFADDAPDSPTLRVGAGGGLSRSNTVHSIGRSANGNSLTSPDSAQQQHSSLSRSRSMGHSRGLSSISYSNSSSTVSSRPASMEGPPLVGLNISHGPAGTQPPGMVRRLSADRGEGLALPVSPSLGSSTSLGGVSELAETESELDSEAERRRANEERASVAAATQPTVIEANADLLSFIAKKERKCLDLREELKRHETELAQLKKRWELIVGKSLTTPNTQPRSLSPTNRFSLTLPRSTPNREGSPSAGDRSPLHSPAALYTSDMSLLASTFDGPGNDEYSEPVDIGTELNNAKAWMGSTMNGMLGKLADVVTTLEESFEGGQEGRLDVLEEEDEDEIGEKHARSHSKHRRGVGEHQSNASASSVDERRASRASSASFDSQSSYGFSSAAVSPTLRSEQQHADTGSTPSTSPNLGRLNQPGPPLSASARTRNVASPSLASTVMASSSGGTPSSHGRSFSLGAFSSVTASSWTSIGKKLSAATNSDTFRNGVIQASQLVDTFEKGLVSALGPLDSQLPPIEGGSEPPDSLNSHPDQRPLVPAPLRSPSLSVGGLGAGFANWARASTGSASSTGSQSPELGRDGERTPKPDGAAFPAEPNKLGGYRRPSASTAANKAAEKKQNNVPAVVEESDDGESWGGW